MTNYVAVLLFASSLLAAGGDKACANKEDCEADELCVKLWSSNDAFGENISQQSGQHEQNQRSLCRNSLCCVTCPCVDKRQEDGLSIEEMIRYHRFLRYQDGIPPDCCIEDKEVALKKYTSVEHFEKCAPLLLPDYASEFYLDASGHRYTFEENFRAFRRLRIVPKILRDVSHLDMSTSVLNQRIPFPIGLSPVALQKMASPLGEIDTVRAAADSGIVMIVSSYASTTLEDISKAAPNANKWMQNYIFTNRSLTTDIVSRAEKAGYNAIVVTVDSPVASFSKYRALLKAKCKDPAIKTANIPETAESDNSITLEDLTWLTKLTYLPVVAKGVLTGEDAIQVAAAGVSAILVSNHGGRQLDFIPATIDSLSEIVDALKPMFPTVEVYLDGGVRNGYDVFKAIALGARMVLIGRPIIWGLTYEGERGLGRIIDILRLQLNETMQLAGTPSLHSISRNMVRKVIPVETMGAL